MYLPNELNIISRHGIFVSKGIIYPPFARSNAINIWQKCGSRLTVRYTDLRKSSFGDSLEFALHALTSVGAFFIL